MDTPQKRKLNPLATVLIVASVFFILFLAVSGVLFMAKGGAGKGSQAFFGDGAVGVIELNGVIMDSRKILKRLERFEESDEIKAVVLRLNSPGGAVAPSQEIYEAVKAYKKPLVVSMGSVAASGAFYIACGAQKVFANPGTITGSIGVIMEFVNLEKLYEWAKVQRYALKTGKYKGSGAEYRELTPEEKALLQAMIDDVLVQFKTAVVEGRKLPMEKVTEVADGRIFSGSQAKALKLVDELGTIQDAINAAGKLAKLKDKPRVVYPEKAVRLLDMILDDPRRGDSDDDGVRGGGLLGALAALLLGGGSGVAQAVHEGVADGAGLGTLAPGIYWLWSGGR